MTTQNWKKLGRLFSPEDLPFKGATHAAVPVVEPLRNGRYRVFYSARNADGLSFTSSFDLNFKSDVPEVSEISEEVVLAPGKLAMFDEHGAMATAFLKTAEADYLFYIGWNLAVSTPFRNSIGLARRLRGASSFEKVSEGPILDRSPFDPCFTASCCVLATGTAFVMWYLSCYRWDMVDGKLSHFYHIRRAESDDLLQWRRDSQVAIPCNEPDEYAISCPRVLIKDGVHHMWYSHRGAAYEIGYSQSDDGKSWRRLDRDVELRTSEKGWDSEMICYPCLFEHDEKLYMLYNGNGYGKTGIGLAVLNPPALLKIV
jgi:hypothetical protein